jgi:hypothetical protein
MILLSSNKLCVGYVYATCSTVMSKTLPICYKFTIKCHVTSLQFTTFNSETLIFCLENKIVKATYFQESFFSIQLNALKYINEQTVQLSTKKKAF